MSSHLMSQNTKQKVNRLVTKYSEFHPTSDNVQFYKPRENQAGGLNIGFQYNSGQMYVQTPKLKNPFGFSRGREGKPEYNKKFTCTLSFDTSTQKGRGFLQAMKDFEEVVLKEAMKDDNLVEWQLYPNRKAAEKATEDSVREKFKPMVKIPTDKDGDEIDDYPPTFRVNFNTQAVKEKDPETGMEVETLKITSEVYGEDGERLLEINEETVPKYSDARCIMYARSVWSTSGNFGVTWRIHQIRVYPGDYVPTGVLMIGDEDSDDEEESRPSTSVPTGPKLLMDDDDDDDEPPAVGDEETDQPTEGAKPSLKNTRNRKKSSATTAA